MKKELTSVKNEGGRPTKITDEVVKQLESVFKLAVTDTTACAYAKISRETFYNRLEKDPVFRDKIASAKEYARIAAGQVVIQAIADKDVQTARWWLEKKHPEEFRSTPVALTQVNVGGEMGVEFISDDTSETT